MAPETELQFDGWTVNRVSGEMRRAGAPVSRLPQQPLRVFVELYDHAGEIVTRDHLVKVLWPTGIVDFDNGLNVAVRKLRVALDDVGDAPKYVETLPKVGYRFIGKDIAPADPAPADPAPGAVPRVSRRAHLAFVLSLAVIGLVVAATWWWSFNERVVAVDVATAAGSGAKHEPSVRAKELYLEALHQRSRRDIDTRQIAREKLEEATREDPRYAAAWAALAENYSVDVLHLGMTPAVGLPLARAAARRAIELDDGLAQGHYVLGHILTYHEKEFAAAEHELLRAKQIDDRSGRFWHHYALLLGQTGRIEAALAASRRARELEPMTLVYAANYGMLLFQARRYDEAIAFLRPVVDANPKFDQARSILARAQLATGDSAGALAQLEARTWVGAFQSDLGVVYAKLGRREDALREVERLGELGREGFPVGYEIASIYTALGDLDAGCEFIARAIEDRSPFANWMRLDPRMDALRGRQCFAEAEAKLYAVEKQKGSDP
jgi:DNA-binding winged helix-turn-helix (wHTH) protein/tetratricopeptide (TPR) repeat protein